MAVSKISKVTTEDPWRSAAYIHMTYGTPMSRRPYARSYRPSTGLTEAWREASGTTVVMHGYGLNEAVDAVVRILPEYAAGTVSEYGWLREAVWQGAAPAIESGPGGPGSDVTSAWPMCGYTTGYHPAHRPAYRIPPWSLIAEVLKLSTLPRGWDGYRARPPADETLEKAIALANFLYVKAGEEGVTVPQPEVGPTPDGSVQYEWRGERNFLAVEVHPSGAPSFFLELGPDRHGGANASAAKLHRGSDGASLEQLSRALSEFVHSEES